MRCTYTAGRGTPTVYRQEGTTRYCAEYTLLPAVYPGPAPLLLLAGPALLILLLAGPALFLVFKPLPGAQEQSGPERKKRDEEKSLTQVLREEQRRGEESNPRS